MSSRRSTIYLKIHQRRKFNYTSYTIQMRTQQQSFRYKMSFEQLGKYIWTHIRVGGLFSNWIFKSKHDLLIAETFLKFAEWNNPKNDASDGGEVLHLTFQRSWIELFQKASLKCFGTIRLVNDIRIYITLHSTRHMLASDLILCSTDNLETFKRWNDLFTIAYILY